MRAPTTTILIVGAGPAGSTTAIELVRRGVDPREILLVDRAEFPRPKLCGGAVNFRGTQWLAELPEGAPEPGAVSHELDFVSRLGKLVIREPGPQWLYDRAVLDHALLERVRRLGVRVETGTPIQEVRPTPTGWRAITRGGAALEARWLIGADGAAGVVRRSVGLEPLPTGRLIEGVYEPVDAEPDPQRLLFDFDPLLDGIPGYAWVFPYPMPKGELRWKLGVMDGLGRVPGAELRRWLAAFAERRGFRPLEGRVPGWPERYYRPSNRAHLPGLVLVGEAHGIDPLLGEGIAPALGMARFAAARIREALDRGGLVIGSYERRFLFTEEGWNLYFHAFLADHLYRGRSRFWLQVLFDTPQLARLARKGTVAYGRMARAAVPLVGSLGVAILRHRRLLRELGPSPRRRRRRV